MIALRVQVRLATVRAALAPIARQIDADMRDAMTAAVRRIAQDARERHAFTNRTGKLEKSIRGARATGSLFRNTLSAEVIADTPYAIFVEERVTWRSWAYLRPAERRMRSEVRRILSDGLTRAVRRVSA